MIPAEILTDTVREHTVCLVVSPTTDACLARSRGLFAMDLEMWPVDISRRRRTSRTSSRRASREEEMSGSPCWM